MSQKRPTGIAVLDRYAALARLADLFDSPIASAQYAAEANAVRELIESVSEMITFRIRYGHAPDQAWERLGRAAQACGVKP